MSGRRYRCRSPRQTRNTAAPPSTGLYARACGAAAGPRLGPVSRPRDSMKDATIERGSLALDQALLGFLFEFLARLALHSCWPTGRPPRRHHVYGTSLWLELAKTSMV